MQIQYRHISDTDIEKLTGHSVTKKEQAGAEESKPAGGPAPKVMAVFTVDDVATLADPEPKLAGKIEIL